MPNSTLPHATAHPIAPFLSYLASLSAPVAKRYFRVPLSVETKADDSPVTMADREIEALLRDAIQEVFSGDDIFGEEHGAERLSASRVWVLDPIDGTKSFISGMPTFGTLIAVTEDGVPVLGMIDMPVLQERWIGAKGFQTTCDGKACFTRTGRALRDASLFATSPEMFQGDDKYRFDAASRLAGLRRFGGDCYAYGLLASGSIDAVVEAGLKPYDFLSLVPIIEGAGGIITDWEGSPLSLTSTGQVVAAGSAQLHAELLEALSGG